MASPFTRWMYSFGWMLLAAWPLPASAAQALQHANLFGNPSFEEGRDQWRLDRAGKTDAKFTVDDKDAPPAGGHSALLSVTSVDDWGVQFGQSMEAPAAGKTYTFSVFAKSTKQPVSIRLEIERRAKPYDRAAASGPVTVSKDRWTEVHVTFKVEKPFTEGWFAYVSCKQPGAEFRLDMARLVEGEYVAYEKAAREERLAAGASLFDTGTSAAAPLAAEAISRKAGWTQLPEDTTDHRFRGDVVLANDRLALALRRGAEGAELYSVAKSGAVPRAVLIPNGAAPGTKLASVAIATNEPAEVAVDARFQADGGPALTIRYSLAMGQPFIKAEPVANVAGLSVEAPSRFVVLPDFFADDIVVDAADIPLAAAELPSENFLLQLLPDRNAIVMTVAKNRVQDARVELAGQGAQRLIRRSRMEFGADGKIWVAVIQGAGVWHVHDVNRAQAGKVTQLDWTAPFSAQWRVDWRLASKLTSSWEMISQLKSGEFLKHGWFGSPSTLPPDRSRWTTVLGRFAYPCWTDRGGRGFLQPLSRPERYEGPAVIYPINRAKETPLREHTVVDVVRATLGVGPCEYILDVEGQGAAMRGRATCATRDTLKPIYAAKQQKQKRAEILRALDEVVIFVKHIRARIEQYVEFGHETLAYLEQQKKAHPELADFFAEMEASARAIDAVVAKRRNAIKSPEYVVGLTEEFRNTLVDYEGDDALARCTRITHAIVDVGGNQDELVGECRAAVKVLRQRAGLAMATNPAAAAVAREIRDRTQKALRNATSYEAPRH